MASILTKIVTFKPTKTPRDLRILHRRMQTLEYFMGEVREGSCLVGGCRRRPSRSHNTQF